MNQPATAADNTTDLPYDGIGRRADGTLIYFAPADRPSDLLIKHDGIGRRADGTLIYFA